MTSVTVPPIASPELARRIRRHVLRMTHRAQSAHIGSCLSMADVLAVAYGEWLRIDPENPHDPTRDRFVLSKGHGCAALYAALAERGFFPLDWLDTYCQDGSVLLGHATHSGVPGVEVSTGALGHGLTLGCGMALAARRGGARYRVLVLASDGECDEGSTWEAALFAGHHRLENLVAIVDYNKIQSLGRVDEVLGLEPLAQKWRAFGWHTVEIDGHDCAAIGEALRQAPAVLGLPTCIVAHTLKGKGVSFMQDSLLWHYRAPDSAELARALAEIDA